MDEFHGILPYLFYCQLAFRREWQGGVGGMGELGGGKKPWLIRTPPEQP